MVSEVGLTMYYSYCCYSLFYLEQTASPNLGHKADSCPQGISIEVRKSVYRCMKNQLVCCQVLSVHMEPDIFLGLVGIMTKKLKEKLSFHTVAIVLTKHRSQQLFVSLGRLMETVTDHQNQTPKRDEQGLLVILKSIFLHILPNFSLNPLQFEKRQGYPGF